MALLRAIVILAGLTTIGNACMYFICRQTFQPWSPQLSPGKCGWQVAKPIANVKVHSKAPPCPPNVHCPNQAKVRSACNCKEVQQCVWAAWGSWTGAVQDASCGMQRRTRLAQVTYAYKIVAGSCSGVVSSCPRNQETEQRTKCRCRKVDVCALSPWTAWSGHVPNGGCATQTSVQGVTPHYTYEERMDNCNGIRSSCNPPRTNSRVKCLCPTKQCTLHPWTQWAVIPGPINSCPKEERFRIYSSVTHYIDAHNDCKYIGVRSCPQKSRQERNKDVKCPRLNAPPYGRLLDRACNGAESSCHSSCGFACNNNFEVDGQVSLKCLSDGSWNGAPPACKDVLSPEISCPHPSSYPNEPGKNYVTIDLPQANATDIVAVVSLTARPKSPLKLVVGSPVEVTYTAVDSTGNNASCSTMLRAIDTEPPRVISCPQNIEKTTRSAKLKVTWPEPVFHDNVEGTSVDRTPSIPNGYNFGKRVYNVLYEAVDKAGNRARCEFNVTVKSPDNICPPYKGPKNGSLVCNNRQQQNVKMFVCGVSCQQGYGLANSNGSSKAFNFYICASNGEWFGSNTRETQPSTMVRLEEGRPWTDCSKTYPADAILKHFTIMAGPCDANKTKEDLKKDFQKKLQSDSMIRYLFCSHSQCDVTDIQVTCATSRKRSTGTLRIEFDLITIPDPVTTPKGPNTFSNVQDLKKIEEMLKKQIEETIKRLQRLLNQLENQIKRILAHLLKINEYLLQIISRPFQVGCPLGSTLSTVGNPPKKLCTKCPIGEMFDSHSNTCKECPRGTYQDAEGKSHCIACPRGSTTLTQGASSIQLCKAIPLICEMINKPAFLNEGCVAPFTNEIELQTTIKHICGPGTYSRDGHGLSTCMACGIGFYQPNWRQPSCISCPNGKTTSGYGSASVRNCS